MDIAVHWGVFHYLRREIKANALILITAMIADIIVLAAFLFVKASTDIFIVDAAITGMVLIVAGERLFLRKRHQSDTQ